MLAHPLTRTDAARTTDQTLCGVSYGASSPNTRPHLSLNSYNATSGTCAKPNVLNTMGAWVIANGAALIPEQKNCDLLCQAKLAAYNNITCANGTPYNNQTCTAVVNRISDTIVANLKTLTSNNAALSIIQTFEINVALYITSTYSSTYNQQVVFLYEYHGQGVQTNQADYYLGYYPAGTSNITLTNGTSIPNPTMGSATCAWCVNGTSAGGWYDVLRAGAAGVEYAAPSTADLVRPAGGLMVASDWAKWVVGNYSSMGLIGWTLERSEAVFGSSPAAPAAWAAGSYNVFDSVGWAYEQHGGQSSLDYEDQLFMLYGALHVRVQGCALLSDGSQLGRLQPCATMCPNSLASSPITRPAPRRSSTACPASRPRCRWPPTARGPTRLCRTPPSPGQPPKMPPPPGSSRATRTRRSSWTALTSGACSPAAVRFDSRLCGSPPSACTC